MIHLGTAGCRQFNPCLFESTNTRFLLELGYVDSRYITAILDP